MVLCTVHSFLEALVDGAFWDGVASWTLAALSQGIRRVQVIRTHVGISDRIPNYVPQPTKRVPDDGRGWEYGQETFRTSGSHN
jgi:hypothetical protein